MATATQTELTIIAATSGESQVANRQDRYTRGYVAGSKAPCGSSHNYGMFDTFWGAGFKDAQRAKLAWV